MAPDRNFLHRIFPFLVNAVSEVSIYTSLSH